MALRHIFAGRADNLEQFNFETPPPALNGETSFAYACGAGGGTRRQSISTFSMLKCSNLE
jgi:hypothetical protein